MYKNGLQGCANNELIAFTIVSLLIQATVYLIYIYAYMCVRFPTFVIKSSEASYRIHLKKNECKSLPDKNIARSQSQMKVALCIRYEIVAKFSVLTKLTLVPEV